MKLFAASSKARCSKFPTEQLSNHISIGSSFVHFATCGMTGTARNKKLTTFTPFALASARDSQHPGPAHMCPKPLASHEFPVSEEPKHPWAKLRKLLHRRR